MMQLSANSLQLPATSLQLPFNSRTETSAWRACENYPTYPQTRREPEGYSLSALQMGDQRRVLVALTRKTGPDESHMTIDFALVY